MSDQRSSDCDQSKRDIPSFIEPRPPLILNPFMRPRPQKGTNLLELFEEDSESEEPELVQVYLRLKPCNVRSNLYEVKSDRCLISSVDTAPMGHGRRTQHHVSKMYTFSHIFGPESNQKQIFEQVVKENLKKLPEGHNFTLLTYGASGSGKTYTLMGTVQSPGLVPRSLEYVFRVVDAAQQPLYKPVDGDAVKLEYYDQDFEIQFVRRLRQVSAPLRDKYRRMSAQLRNDLTTSTLDLTNRTRYFVWVSFVEIYNEAIYDLLTNCDRSKATSKLRIREDSNGQVYVKGATQAFVRTGEEAYDVLVAGKHNLQVAATGVHANSSRSHCIFTITMLAETEEGVRTSCVRLCDLAGCERQRHARNTGARMQESRAINSSLHVLERCLHMLRRKQKKIDATLVPYRESKLTRLLGAGLSGARGEAVSMVVTLNPAPQYLHETRHVLQLAAVAKDIQVNQTIQESTFESSTQDSNSTIEPSRDYLRLRSENERLHFELIQAQSRNKELLAAMAEKQAEVATTMFEIVEEAKDMTRQYYEAQLQALRTEMEEMQEEYESKLKAVAAADPGTPSKKLNNKITELMTEIAILEEKLAAEKLARARAEEEVQHLRACIEERDEKAEQDYGQNHEEVMSSTDEESEDEDDPYNESLEPTFKKEDINRSRLLQQSLIIDSKNVTVNDDQDTINDLSTINDNNSDADNDDKNETLKDDDDSREVTVKDSTYLSDESNITEKFEKTQDIVMNNEVDASNNVEAFVDVTMDVKNTKSSSVRGTYVVTDDLVSSKDETKPISPEYPIVLSSFEKTKKSIANMEESLEKLEKSFEQGIDHMTDKLTDIFVSKLFTKKSTLSCTRSEGSLAHFEQLEIASKSDNSKSTPVEPLETFSNIKILKEKRNFFDDDKDDNNLIPKLNKDSKAPYFDDTNINSDSNKNLAGVKKLLNDERSPSIVKDDVTENIEPSTMKKLLGESFSRLSVVTTISLPKKQASVDIFEGFDSPNVFKLKELPELLEKPPQVFHISEKDDSKCIADPESFIASNTTRLFNKEMTDIFVKPKDVLKSTTADNSLTQSKDNISILENCIEKKVSLCVKENDVVGDTCRSIEQMCLKSQSHHKIEHNNVKIKLERPSIDPQSNDASLSSKHSETQSALQINYNNTVDDFDNIYKDITPRATEFELLIAQNNSNINESKFETEKDTEKPKYNLRHTKVNTSIDKKETSVKIENVVEKNKSINKKTNSHKKDTSINKNLDTTDKNDTTVDKTNSTIDKIENVVEKNKSINKKTDSHKKDTSINKNLDTTDKNDTTVDKTNSTIDKTESLDKNANTSDEVLLESAAKCESKAKPKRNLRLRKRKEDNDRENVKLKDIVNLQKEFSDVTMDVPAPVKEVKDIESPEKRDDENLPPLLGIQSCPSKSVTRSRRKLFTPRAEPLEESMGPSGDSNERIRVPRPSYHRTRARRKL